MSCSIAIRPSGFTAKIRPHLLRVLRRSVGAVSRYEHHLSSCRQRILSDARTSLPCATRTNHPRILAHKRRWALYAAGILSRIFIYQIRWNARGDLALPAAQHGSTRRRGPFLPACFRYARAGIFVTDIGNDRSWNYRRFPF